MDVAQVIERIVSGDFDSHDVELLITAYTPLIDKYVAILSGKLVSSEGKSFLRDENVKMFAYSFNRGGDVLKTLQWVIKQCKNFTYSEIRAEVTRSFLECIIYKGWMKEFPYKLARNVAELIGNPMEVLVAEIKTSTVDPANLNFELLTRAEIMFSERGIVLTSVEKRIIQELSKNYNVERIAAKFGVSKQAIYATLRRLKKKASL